jgi:hypothetical protein
MSRSMRRRKRIKFYPLKESQLDTIERSSLVWAHIQMSVTDLAAIWSELILMPVCKSSKGIH